MARKCKGKTLARSGSDGEESGSEELIPRQQNRDKNEAEHHNEEEEEEEVNRKREKSAGQSDGEEAKNEKKEKEEEQQPDQPEVPNPEPAQDPQDPDVDRLQAIFSARSISCLELSNLIISINQQKKLNQITVEIKQRAFSHLCTCLRGVTPEVFKRMVIAINVLGRLDEIRDQVERECDMRSLALNEILAEQQP